MSLEPGTQKFGVFFAIAKPPDENGQRAVEITPALTADQQQLIIVARNYGHATTELSLLYQRNGVFAFDTGEIVNQIIARIDETPPDGNDPGSDGIGP